MFRLAEKQLTLMNKYYDIDILFTGRYSTLAKTQKYCYIQGACNSASTNCCNIDDSGDQIEILFVPYNHAYCVSGRVTKKGKLLLYTFFRTSNGEVC
jgi:hypothetical protein